ncbi:MAG: hypothetical protein ABIQ27_02800 [Flavobacterium sp.]|uniref:hypothetical protein n=1 Tax=Flavobacterium sp. TaxID=239 RepID=UPI0032636B08
MKNSFKKALKLFKYLSILFSITYWTYMIYDDWIFIENYWDTNWQDYICTWTVWFLIYFWVFAFYYWLTAIVVALVYHKLIKRKR